MGISSIVAQLLNEQRRIDIKSLPSQGLFYKEDFKIWIKKANVEDIIRYEYNYKKSIESIIYRVKKIAKKNIVLSKNYIYEDIKSIDIIYLFFEIVKFTSKKDIKVDYFNTVQGSNDEVTFDNDTFNYLEISNETMFKYDEESREFVIDGFRYSLPCIGIESCLTNFLVKKSNTTGSKKYEEYSYSFIYFLGHKSDINDEEIDNLVEIFNNDISDEDKVKINNIVSDFSDLAKYSLKKDNQVIDISSKIDLEKIWK